MADSCANKLNKELLRNPREIDRWQRKMENPEQHNKHLKRHRKADKNEERQKPPRNVVVRPTEDIP